MIDEQMRVKIAEACGMKWYIVGSPLRSVRRFLYWPSMIVGHEGLEPATMSEPIANFGWDWFKYMPDYPNDLNACHEMEKVLNEAQCFKYRDTLQEMVLKERARTPQDFCFGATARQRCEAFLKTIGQWEEDK